MTRVEKILAHIDARAGRGVEIGPLTSPVLSKREANVVYVDRASKDELIRWFSTNPKLDTSAILDVDYVWGDRTLKECVGGRTFDFCIASHVMEHVPDMITWLQEVHAILDDEGVLSVVLPDKRYMFDCLRALSGVPDVIDAFVNKRRKPSTRQIYEHFSQIVDVEAAALWRHSAEELHLRPNAPGSRELLAICADAKAQSTYIDSHCWVFTPLSFLRILEELAGLGLVDFELAGFVPTSLNDAEFFASLRKLPGGIPPDERVARTRSSFERAIRDIETASPGGLTRRERAQIEALERELGAANTELSTLKASKSWRCTAPLRSLAELVRRVRTRLRKL